MQAVLDPRCSMSRECRKQGTRSYYVRPLRERRNMDRYELNWKESCLIYMSLEDVESF